MERYYAEHVEEHAENMPDYTAYVFMDEEKSYREFNEDVNRVARSLLDRGIERGDRVATVLPESPAFLNLFMAASKTGIELVPLDPRYKPPEMVYRCERTNPKAFVGLGYPESIAESVEKALKEIEVENVFSYFGELDVEGSESFESLLDSSPDPIPEKYRSKPDDSFIIIFTSGTTGEPKGAMLDQRATEAMSKATVNRWGMESSDVILSYLPTSHVGATHDTITSTVFGGGTLILMPRFDTRQALELVEKHDITVFGGVPTVYRLIFKQVEDWEKYDRSSVRIAILSGEPSSAELVEKVQDFLPNADVVVSYGLTESCGFFTFSKPSDDLEVAKETEGTPAPGFEMKAVKSDGSEAETGEVGELWIKGDSLMKGYLDEERTEEAMEDGWFKTGDLGFLDENKYLHYVGRSKEMFISGGYNVYPLKIESYLNEHPNVSTSFVTEVPHEIWGEVGWAFILPREGAEIDEGEMKKYCEEGLADYKIPRKFIIKKEFPRTDVGKVDKQKLRKEIDIEKEE